VSVCLSIAVIRSGRSGYLTSQTKVSINSVRRNEQK